MAGWLFAACFVALFVALAARGGSGSKKRWTRASLWPTLHLPEGISRVRRWLGPSAGRLAVRYWRPFFVVAVLILPLAALSGAGGGSGPLSADLTISPALVSPTPEHQKQGVIGVRKKRQPKVAALGLNPPSQPPPQRPQPITPTPVATPTPLPPLVLPPPTAPGDTVVGLSTWYGGIDGFGPEDTMADGTQFDPTNPTIAAANWWPLGTWLKVCLQDRCIGVQVRDTGAFGHALDLSHAAFAELAPPSRGVITVTISRLN